MAQNISLKCKGLFTQPNSLSDVPVGGLLQADNIVVTRDDVAEPRRGFAIYGNAMGSSATTDVAKQFLIYKNRLIRHYTSTIQFDNGSGTFTSFTGSYSETESGLRIKGAEVNGNLYFTTSVGIKKMSAASAAAISSSSITQAGGVKALDTSTTLNSDPGFFLQDSAVAYRIVWGIKDANNNLILGAPSQRSVITNPITDLLIPNFNNLLTDLDGVSNPSGINAGDYHSTLNVATSSAPSLLRTNLISLAAKIDNDTVITKSTIDVSSSKRVTTSTASIVFSASVATLLEPGDVISPSVFTNTDFNTRTLTVNTVSTTTITCTILDGGVFGGTDGSPVAESGASSVKRLKYTLITQPVALSDIPTTDELVSMQTYYDTIVGDLQLEPSGIITTTTPFDNDVSTQSATVNVTFTIPAGVTTAHFYQLYRSPLAQSTGVSTLQDQVPSDELGLVLEDNPTSGEISAGTITVQDITPESFRGANLYTNPNSGEGIAQANEPPPKAKDVTFYKNFLFLANTETRQSKTLSLLSVTNLVADTSTLTLTDGTTTNTYTFAASENTATQKVLISTADTPAQQVDETARSLVHVINLNPASLVYAYYLSGPSDVPGQILFQARTIGTVAYHFLADSTLTGDQFSPGIPTSGSLVISDNDISPNRIYYSKNQQPEAVPLLNYFDVGPKDRRILRILGLRESLFVFKEEGIYRVTGDSAPFVVNLFDSSSILSAADTACVLNNEIYCLTNQGIAKASDTGISILSRAIETDILKLSSVNYTHYETASFALASETDRTYYLFTVTDPTDTKATQCLKFNTFTNAWTRAIQTKTCGIDNYFDDKIYLGAGDLNYIEQERKNFDRTDYSDREYTQTLSSTGVSGSTLTLPSVTNVSARDVIVQTQYLTISKLNQLLMKLDSDSGVADNNYYSTLGAVAGNNLRDILTALATKLDSDSGIVDNTFASGISAFTSSFSDTQLAFNVIVNKLNVDLGATYFNYPLSSGTTPFEVILTSVNKNTSKVITEYAFPFIAGPITTYAHISCTIRWAPITFGDPSLLKQVSESTVIFERNSFSSATVSYASDLNPGFDSISFNGAGNGIFGNGIFGDNTFGGSGTSIPFRTYVPTAKQRCRYISIKFEHGTSREIFSVFGVSLTANSTSTRAYR